jgi:thiamine-phosphate diphosphorylase
MIITDRKLAGERDWLSVVDQALAAGATAVQLRDKHASSRELLAMSNALKPLVDRHGALFLVNDRFDVALACAAHGVHLGDDDLPVAEVRRVVPRDFVIGRSADTEEEARAAESAGADYLGVGSVFGTRTKAEVIGEVIGTGGKVIREICEVTGAKVDIEDDGTVKVAAVDTKAAEAAIDWIRNIVAEPEVGAIYRGKVVKVVDFGAFVNFLGSRDGLVHISELSPHRVKRVTDVVKEGDMVTVKVLGFDDRGKVKLSMKAVDQETGKDLTKSA